ncbi:MAG TPA: GMC family oxidoreductase [Candidatus Angelobacter sp.]|nr:GMC family oxidoreductase [Candidatus Angelobacter sp.]
MRPEIFDAIVVGSGMTGGLAAKLLSEAGLRVLVLEAGPNREITSNEIGLDETKPGKSTPEKSSAAGTAAVQSRCYAFSERTRPYFVNDRNDPYVVPPRDPFSWIRARTIGGKSLLWAGHCYRMTDLDFHATERDGVGSSWPLHYRELAPYYAEAERILQVRGFSDGLAYLPDGDYTAASPLRSEERRLQQAAAAMGRPLVRARMSHDARTAGQTPCLHCGRIDADCARPVTSADSTLAEALQTGRAILRTASPVRSITTNAHGHATGVCAVNRETGELFEAGARLIFLCASALESTRILLNSASSLFPYGLGNSSGALGRYLMDHVSGITATGIFESDAGDANEASERGAQAGLLYMPRWQNLRPYSATRFLRGYGCQLFTMPADHELLPCVRTQLRPNASAKKPNANSFLVSATAFGEMLPSVDNFVEIDRGGHLDADGIPILNIHCRYDENERAMAKDMLSSVQEILIAVGATLMELRPTVSEPGLAIHEAGTCRMGHNRNASVLNPFNQCHDAANVFVTDGSCFPSVGTQNPALTMMALTIRACRYAIELLKKGELK